MRSPPCLSLATALLGAALLGLAPAAADARCPGERPCLMPGKTSLFERVLSRPHAVLRAEPNEGAAIVDDAVHTFTPFYVYGQSEAGDGTWLQVGQSEQPPTQGWMRESETVPWRQTIIVSFPNPAERERVLFFRDRDELHRLIRSEDVVLRTRELRRQAEEGTLPDDHPLIAIEPAEYVDFTERFYLLPILEHEVHLDSMLNDYRLLKVGSIPLQADREVAFDPEEALRDMRAGAVFAIDTTISMAPYIERTREAVRRILQQVGDSPIGDRVRFGLVGFRDSLELAPRLEYLARTYAPLSLDLTPEETLALMETMQVTEVSSVEFNEDSFAGVVEALEQESWPDFDARYVVLITDAGPRHAADPHSSTGATAKGINRIARDDKGIAISVMHLLTDEGAHTHDYAREHYVELAAWEEEPLYFPVPTGSPEEFGQMIDRFVDGFVANVQTSFAGRLIDLEEEAVEDDVARRTAAVGRAMQLAYLGRVGERQAPEMFEAWVSDRQLDSLRRHALDVRLLLTKNQLSDLHESMAFLYDAAHVTITEPERLFDRIASMAAHASRVPGRLGRGEFAELGELLGEYLEDLPYTSPIMRIDPEEWVAAGGGAHAQTMDSIYLTMRNYRDYNDTPGLWAELWDGAPDGERVYPLPFDELP